MLGFWRITILNSRHPKSGIYSNCCRTRQSGHSVLLIRTRQMLPVAKKMSAGKIISTSLSSVAKEINHRLWACILSGCLGDISAPRRFRPRHTGGISPCAPPARSGGGPPHSKTLRARGGHGSRASVLECGGPPPLSPAGQTVPRFTKTALHEKRRTDCSVRLGEFTRCAGRSLSSGNVRAYTGLRPARRGIRPAAWSAW